MAAVAGSDEIQQENSRKIAVKNARGEKLVGIFNDTGSSEICILCHGQRSSKDLPILKWLSSALAEIGLSSFRFDFSGNGESEGEFSYGGYWKEVEDLRAVVEYWRTQGRQVNVVIGHSKGASSVLLYASKYGDVPTFINLSGRCDLKGGLTDRVGEDYMERLNRDGYVILKEAGIKIPRDSLMERLSIETTNLVKAIPSTCRTFTIHGTEDERVAVEEAYKFDKAIPNHTLKIIPGANHRYAEHKKELTSAVLEIIQGQKRASS